MTSNLSNSFFKTDSPIAVVAGGAGFVGSFVCQILLKKGVRVVCVDDWQIGVKENINEFLTNKNFLLLEKDISARFSKKISKVDYVFHLGCLEFCLNKESTTVEFLNKVSLGTKNLLDLAKLHGARFLLVACIGDECSFAERLVLQYGREKGLDVRVVRLGEVYGPKMLLAGGSIIAKIVKDAIYGNRITKAGDEQNFSAVFIDDVAQAILRAAFTSAGGSVVSVEPKIPLSDGLKKTIDWFVDRKIYLSKREPEGVLKEDHQALGFWDNVLKEKQSSEVSEKKRPLAILSLKIFLGLTGGLLFWFAFLPFINLFSGLGSLSLARRAFLDDGGRSFYFWAGGADFLFSASRGGFSQWAEFPFLEEGSARFYRKASRGVEVTRVGTRVFDILENSKLVLGGVFGKTNIEDLDGKFTNLSSELDRLDQELGFIEAEYKGESLAYFNRSLIKFASDMAREQSLFFGRRGQERTYVFLFQDKEVVRGVRERVESFGIAVFRDGRFDNWRLEDAAVIYGEDAAETTEVSAYFQLKSSSAYFPKLARDAKKLLEESLGLKVDGIFYFDKKHKEDVGDFVRDPRQGLPAFIRAFSQAVEKREMALWVPEPKISSILKTWGLDGSFRDPKCQKLSCIQDYLQVAVNSLVDSPKRKYSLEVTLEGSSLSHRMVVSYPEDRDVSEYLMIVVPTKSKKGGAFLVDFDQKNIEIDEYKEGGRKTFGLFVEGVKGEAKNLIVEWDLPIEGSQELSFVWQKQLGAPSIESSFNFEYSTQGWEFVSSYPDALLTKEGVLGYNTSLSEDFVLSIQWQAKN